MAKKKVEKPKREVTKRQLSHWQQQQKRQRIILISGIVVLAVVSIIMLVGWYFSYYQPLHQVVISVDEAEFEMDYYVKMLKLYGEGWPTEYMDMLADEVVGVIARNELVRKGALMLGVVVSDEEIREKLDSYDPPLTSDYKDVARTELLVDKLLDGHFEQEVPLVADQVHLMAMFLESESQAAEVRARIESGDDFGQLAGELSLHSFSQENNGDLGWHPEEIVAELLATSVPGEYAFTAEVGVLSPPVYDETMTKSGGYWLVKILSWQPELEQIQVRAILLGSEAEAWEARDRLEAGEDFATLAGELSQDEATGGSGGDFGWLSPEDVGVGSIPAVWSGLFALEVGVVSEPIPDDTQVTTGGYWLLEVLDKEDDRQISDDDRDSLKSNALDEWMTSLWSEYEDEIQSYLTDEMKVWAIERATG